MEVSGLAGWLHPLASPPPSIPTTTTTTTTITTTSRAIHVKTTMTTAPFISTSTSLRLQMLIGRRRRRRVGVICDAAADVDWKLPHLKMSIGSSRPTRGRRRRRRRVGGGVICMAGGPDGGAGLLSHDTPFAIAIAASMLHSLLFPMSPPSPEDHQDAVDVISFPVMTIISLIPFFNWLSWVFAFMESGNRRYAVYAAVYLAPYLRTNLSLSPDDSWLPIASIVLCIIHIQLEASIRSGDLDTFAFFHEAAARFGLVAKSQQNLYKGKSMKLPSSQSQQREWEDHKKPSQEAKHGNEDSDLDDGTDQH